MSDLPLLNSSILFDLVMNQRYGVEYQPIIDQHGQIFGYEALARFFTPDGDNLSPLQVFNALHRSPLSFYEVEYAIKQLQLEQAPATGMLFVNLDPHAAAAWGCLDDSNPLLRLLRAQQNLCVEMIENTDITDARICLELTEFFRAEGVPLALDDLGAPDSLLSIEVLVAVDFVKFDRSWLCRLTQPHYRELMKMLVDYTKKSGKRVILEGIETKEDMALAHECGIDLVQGFLYRDRFIAHNCCVTSAAEIPHTNNQQLHQIRQTTWSKLGASDKGGIFSQQWEACS